MNRADEDTIRLAAEEVLSVAGELGRLKTTIQDQLGVTDQLRALVDVLSGLADTLRSLPDPISRVAQQGAAFVLDAETALKPAASLMQTVDAFQHALEGVATASNVAAIMAVVNRLEQRSREQLQSQKELASRLTALEGLARRGAIAKLLGRD